VVGAYFLWQSVIPDDLRKPSLDEAALFPTATLAAARSYERFVRWDYVLAQLAVLAVVAVYARVGPRFVRESAAGPIGTGMLLAMLGFGLVWLLQLPFGLAELWWQRRHDVSRASYGEWIWGGWVALGGQFLFVSLAILIVVGLAQVIGDWWWLPGGAVFVGLAALFSFLFPYLIPGQKPLHRPALAAQARAYERELGLPDIPIRVQDVSSETTAPNAEAVGLGPTRRVVLWSTILRPPFTQDEQEVVVAHELGHHARKHLYKSVGWYALFAIPGAFIISRATRRRGGMRNPEAVPLGLLTLVVLSLLATPLLNIVTRHMEAEADWVALTVTHDPGDAEGLFKEFTQAAHSDPSPPAWSYVLLETHPTVLQRIEMARAWAARQQPTP
jgi:STE24 endopeptidase